MKDLEVTRNFPSDDGVTISRYGRPVLCLPRREVEQMVNDIETVMARPFGADPVSVLPHQETAPLTADMRDLEHGTTSHVIVSRQLFNELRASLAEHARDLDDGRRLFRILQAQRDDLQDKLDGLMLALASPLAERSETPK